MKKKKPTETASLAELGVNITGSTASWARHEGRRTAKAPTLDELDNPWRDDDFDPRGLAWKR